MWDNYQDNFPKRYIVTGFFDEYIKKILAQLKPDLVLDIGGGATGTEALKGTSGTVYLLDPYIDVAPGWMAGKVDWHTPQKFDLIVARGSINYLSNDQLRLVPVMLNSGGVFIANTFVKQPKEEWVEREYKNMRGGGGLERSRYNRQRNVVEHELIPWDGKIIRHEFWFRSQEDYSDILTDVNFISYKNNSVILNYQQVT